MNKIEKIKSYWDEQAESFGTDAKATTQDSYLRKIEINYICEYLSSFEKRLNVLDIGCGNGYSTVEYARRVPKHNYVGGDYSEKMINNAKKNIENDNRGIVEFSVLDVTCLSKFEKKYDIIISDRCLINLPGIQERKQAINEIYKSLNHKGIYLMIENFIEGNNEFNKLRSWIELPTIDIRWHNSFMSQLELEQSTKNLFDIERFENISSLYYLITRVAYSKTCELENRQPDYDNKIYEAAALLPPVGNFGPVCACILKKQEKL